MKILGVDPSLASTGYGVIDVAENQCDSFVLLETGIIKPRQKDSLQHKVNKVYTNLDNIITEFNPEIMVLEKLYSHHKFPTTASILGHVRGVICLLCSQRNLELKEYSVKRIRKTLLGNGSATKQQTRESVAHMLKIDADKLTLDASDALALALGFALMPAR